MLGFGASWEAIDAAIAEEEAENSFPVFEENMPIVEAFAALGTQWRIATPAMGGLLWSGLDYSAVAALPQLRAAEPEKYQEVFNGIRLMENAARKVLNEPRDA